MKSSFLASILVLFACGSTKSATQNEPIETIYQFKVNNLYGELFDFASLKGKKIMIVNTASKCGLTPQYKQLQELYENYQDQKFIIIGFPANNFMWQEPGTNAEIGAFCTKNYGVTFPMMEKVSVKGKNMHPIYQFLTQKEKNGFKDSRVKWNFQKYLIDEHGQLAKIISPKKSPLSQEIINWIEE